MLDKFEDTKGVISSRNLKKQTILCPKKKGDKNTNIGGQDMTYISMVFHSKWKINDYFLTSLSFYVKFVRKPLRLFDLEIVTFFVMWYCI